MLNAACAASFLLAIGCGGEASQAPPPTVPADEPSVAHEPQPQIGPLPTGVADMVSVSETSIVVLEKILFGYNSAIIDKESYPILDAVAEALILYTHILHVHVQGHSDDRGLDPYNNALTLKRAHAVVNYLASKGVDPGRLSTGGYAAHCPLDVGQTPEAWAKNRRVDFLILETDKGCTGAEIACPDAIDAGLVPGDVRKYLPDGGYCQ